MENYCHNQVATAANKLQQGCPLFETKSDNVGEAVAHSIETAEQFRNFKELGLLPSLNEISAYEYTCFDAAERAVRQVNAEVSKPKPDKKSASPLDTGDNRPKKTGGPPQ